MKKSHAGRCLSQMKISFIKESSRSLIHLFAAAGPALRPVLGDGGEDEFDFLRVRYAFAAALVPVDPDLPVV